jgi:hypothetical protein
LTRLKHSRIELPGMLDKGGVTCQS